MFVADFPRSTHQYNIAYDFPMILARKGCGVFPTSIDSTAQMHQMRRPGAFPEWRVEREVWDRAEYGRQPLRLGKLGAFARIWVPRAA